MVQGRRGRIQRNVALHGLYPPQRSSLPRVKLLLPTMTSSSSNSAEPNLNVRVADSHARNQEADSVEHHIDVGIKAVHKSFSWKNRKPNHVVDWAQPNTPYHEYVKNLVAAGWTNLLDLNKYMSSADPQEGLVVSIIDISDDGKEKRWPDLDNEIDLRKFLQLTPRNDAKVRLYVAEYVRCPSSALIEVLGSSLKLDPRFFQWSIWRKGHVFTPSQRHRAPYMSLGFGILASSEPRRTDAEKFKVMVYVQVGASLRIDRLHSIDFL